MKHRGSFLFDKDFYFQGISVGSSLRKLITEVSEIMSREVTVVLLCSLRACCESGGASLMQFLHDNQTFALSVRTRELEAPLVAC